MRLSKLLENQASSNAAQTTIDLLKQLQVPVTNTTVIEEIEYHPDYPSLYSINDSKAKGGKFF